MDKYFACLGDSITSDSVTGIGSLICTKLNMILYGNYARGWATCSDWHYGAERLTAIDLLYQANDFAPQNVLSNQVYQLLKRVNDVGYHPDIIYIAISTNDGSVDWCKERGTPVPVFDDTLYVCKQRYEELTRMSIASALRWAIDTLQKECPSAYIFVASPLQAYSPNREVGALSESSGLLKREIIRKICDYCQVIFIDSYAESNYTREIAREHGEVHPDDIWKDKIADYVSHRIKMFIHSK